MQIKTRIGLLFLLAFLSCTVFKLHAQKSSKDCYLFKINRSRDANYITYDINFDESGIPNQTQPINIYWVKKNDLTEPLTWIQNRYAYGIKVLDNSKKPNCKNDSLCFQFVSYNKKTFILKKDKNSFYKVFTKVGTNDVEVTGVFVQIDGGSFWFPVISRVDLLGVDLNSGELIVESIRN